MTAVPLPRQPSPSTDSTSSGAANDTTPVFALKELVARLHKEQRKIQDLLSSLGFALRSFNNLNQFLELIPMMATRVTDADGGILIRFLPNGQVRLERLHCQEGQACQDIRKTYSWQLVRSVTRWQKQRCPKVTTQASLLLCRYL
jgi:sigma-B regulation protein RsbU (phosphoserine phosphatase)